MSRRKLIWHIGPASAPRAVIARSLEVHEAALEAAGVRPVASAEESTRATHELLRTHREAGLARREVDGQWSRICDRVWRHKGTSVLSTPDLCVADKDQVKLALDALIGVEVHLVFALDSLSQQLYGGWLAELRAGRATGWEKYVARILDPASDHRQHERFWAGHDVAAMLARWGYTFRADRLHVLGFSDPGQHWRELLDLAGVADQGLAAVLPAYADPAGVAVLRRVNRQLDRPLARGSVDLLTAVERAGVGIPAASTLTLQPMVTVWEKAFAEAGYDVRGDLGSLLAEGEGALPGPRDQLAVAVDALAEVLAENSRLRGEVSGLSTERDRLDRKRRKLKRRLKQGRPAGVPQN